MANPRQRRKARSSSHRPVSHTKHAKRNLKKMPTIRGPNVLRECWDKKKTLKQNYAALGLLDSLNPQVSGRIEKNQETSVVHLPEASNASSPNAFQIQSLIPPGFGRIIRDGTGNVVQVEMNERVQHTMGEKDTQIGMERLDPVIGADVLTKWLINENTTTACREGSSQQIYISNALEKISTPRTASRTLSFASSGVGPRYSSKAETLYLQKLVDKYGDNIDQMTKDHKLNSDQRTPVQLRNALRRAGLSTQ
ncbi:Nucleolar protein 16 [Leucoagaricus gongylophorus]